MIPKIKNILYATDLSKNSAYAFRYAVNSAQKHDADIHILHVMEGTTDYMDALLTAYIEGLVSMSGSEDWKKKRRETQDYIVGRIKDRLRQFAERELKDDPGILKRVVSIEVVPGDPATEILGKAENPAMDIVILGTHGRGVIRHAFLGSVSEKVLQRIRKPVFVIPLPEGETDITLGEM